MPSDTQASSTSRWGDYAFRLASDDGSRLFVDGKIVIDNDGVHTTRSVSGNIYLDRGEHFIEVDYFQSVLLFDHLEDVDDLSPRLFWSSPP
ncbi:MAG: hypothetical protein JW986_06280 [Methanotrichaceae archaeon]|nr:hypothetical protein [Methanotrichaceae archaeon]